MTTTILRSDDLACPTCVAGLEKMLRATGGVETATVHFMSGGIEIHHDPERVGAAALAETIRKAGYRLRSSSLPYDQYLALVHAVIRHGDRCRL
jgi:copper chaperone